VSTAVTGVLGPRKADGSLPDVDFLKLKAGSPLIDKGTDVMLPFVGAKPDLGADEFGAVAPPLGARRLRWCSSNPGASAGTGSEPNVDGAGDGGSCSCRWKDTPAHGALLMTLAVLGAALRRRQR
jgi:hypothetical protein